jgi:hypothetical protein
MVYFAKQILPELGYTPVFVGCVVRNCVGSFCFILSPFCVCCISFCFTVVVFVSGLAPLL